MVARYILQATDREVAPRHLTLLEGDDLEAEIERLNIEMSTVALNSLIRMVTSDTMR
jgi:hypothetical protein